MDDIYLEIEKICQKGEKGALATIISTRGSTPRKEGAKMLVRHDGSAIGTISGGCVEAEVWQEAMEVIKSRKSKTLSFVLTEKEAGESGLICGGTMKVFIEPI
ncbi:MAG: XdhC family protein [bacterium]|nr:XdhC family protein [bacterium]